MKALRELIAKCAFLRIPVINRLAVFTEVVFLMLFGSLYGLRVYQDYSVGELLHNYSTAEVEEMAISRGILDDGDTFITYVNSDGGSELIPYENGPPVKLDYLVLELCNETGNNNIPITFRYQPGRRSRDFSHRMSVPVSACGSARLFFPVFYADWAKFTKTGETVFQGIEITQKDVSYWKGLYRIKDPGKLGLLLYLTLPCDWERCLRHQAFEIERKLRRVS